MSVIQINMHEAKSRLSELAERVWAGDRVVIAKAGKPYLDLLPHQGIKPRREPGCLKGKIVIPDDFDQTSPEIIAAFEDGSL